MNDQTKLRAVKALVRVTLSDSFRTRPRTVSRVYFAVPEGVGATKIRATCRSARGTFDASWRRVEKATMALGRVQNFASHLAWQWHTAMEGAQARLF